MKSSIGPVFQAFRLDPAARSPLYRQLYEELRDALLSGSLPAGGRLPSTRSLAGDLALSRNTVSAAYERLIDEGLIESRHGAGSFASPLLANGAAQAPLAASAMPDAALTSAPMDGVHRSTAASVGGTGATETPNGSCEASAPRRRDLSARGRAIAASTLGPDAVHPLPFAIGVPALDAFPRAAWIRTQVRRTRRLKDSELAAGSPAGLLRLREQVAFHLSVSRGVRCTAEQVMILPSVQLGLDLAARVLVDPGDPVWLEEPGYLGARGAFTAAGARIVPVPVDTDGLRVDVGRALEPSARLALVTPSHQFPLGSSMPLERRLQLLAWAREAGSWILEDDYDSEFRHDGRSVQALQGLDTARRVLYLGTFTKVLFPALRIAYLVLPEDLIDPFHTARFLLDGHTATGPQAALADFLEAGHLTAHLRRMRTLYRQRRDALLAELDRRFSGVFGITGAEAGLHVAARFRNPAIDDRPLATAASAFGLDIVPLSRYFLGQAWSGLAIGYAHVPEAEIAPACDRLEALMNSLGLL